MSALKHRQNRESLTDEDGALSALLDEVKALVIELTEDETLRNLYRCLPSDDDESMKTLDGIFIRIEATKEEIRKRMAQVANLISH